MESTAENTKSLIERIYNGELHPNEEIIPRDKKYRPTMRKIGEEKEYFKSLLTPKNAKRFDYLEDLVVQKDYMISFANFDQGFQMGIELMSEVFFSSGTFKSLLADYFQMTMPKKHHGRSDASPQEPAKKD